MRFQLNKEIEAAAYGELEASRAGDNKYGVSTSLQAQPTPKVEAYPRAAQEIEHVCADAKSSAPAAGL